MATPDSSSQDGRYIPFPGPQGWGAATFIVLLAASLVFGAYSIHKATYKPPTDPTDVPGYVRDSILGVKG
jgi:hypothetical protein